MNGKALLSEIYLSYIYLSIFIGGHNNFSAFLIDFYLSAFKCFHAIIFPFDAVDEWCKKYVQWTN